MSDTPPLIQILRAPPTSTPGSRHPSTIVEWPAVAEHLQRLASQRARPAAAEQCELCSAEISSDHGHLVNVPNRALLCVCRPCYLLFTHDGAGNARFRAVPQRYEVIPAFATAREHWEALQIPIGLAFFFQNSATGRTTAFYPSPAGATESELPLDAWGALTGAVPIIATLAPDVEALLVRRYDPASPQGPQSSSGPVVDALIVPIDACYELVGRIRRTWRGFQGGDDVWQEIDQFFEGATARAREMADL